MTHPPRFASTPSGVNARDVARMDDAASAYLRVSPMSARSTSVAFSLTM